MRLLPYILDLLLRRIHSREQEAEFLGYDAFSVVDRTKAAGPAYSASDGDERRKAA